MKPSTESAAAGHRDRTSVVGRIGADPDAVADGVPGSAADASLDEAPPALDRHRELAKAALGGVDDDASEEARLHEARLYEARLYAEAIIDSLREPLLVLDRDLQIHSVNQPFSALFGVTMQDAVASSLREIDAGKWDVETLVTQLQRVFESGEPMDAFEYPREFAGLGARELLLNARPLRRGGGRPELILVSIEDVTERRRVEALLLENQEHRRVEEHIRRRQLELTDALRVSTVGELATGLAHELNQPLSSISNTVEACARYVRGGTIDPAKLLELLSDVAAEAMRAAGIVAHLRSFVEKGEPDLEAVDLEEVVSHVPHLMLRELDRTRVELRMHLSGERLPIEADRIQIEQVVVNLLQNAMDSIREAERPTRRIELSVRLVDGAGEVSVRDTGIGVTGPATERLFEPFFTTKPQGLGMGLALSRSILEAHRGRIWMEDPFDGGPGAVVRFSIPLKAAKRRRKDAKA